ncbi:MAG: hypothetical protein K0R51_3509 [Cytophagaceae bacterium]|jgi:hypothetical protein|nr:hypothetical protein [Cytophagaceae bacterium]
MSNNRVLRIKQEAQIGHSKGGLFCTNLTKKVLIHSIRIQACFIKFAINLINNGP